MFFYKQGTLQAYIFEYLYIFSSFFRNTLRQINVNYYSFFIHTYIYFRITLRQINDNYYFYFIHIYIYFRSTLRQVNDNYYSFFIYIYIDIVSFHFTVFNNSEPCSLYPQHTHNKTFPLTLRVFLLHYFTHPIRDLAIIIFSKLFLFFYLFYPLFIQKYQD